MYRSYIYRCLLWIEHLLQIFHRKIRLILPQNGGILQIFHRQKAFYVPSINERPLRGLQFLQRTCYRSFIKNTFYTSRIRRSRTDLPLIDLSQVSYIQYICYRSSIEKLRLRSLPQIEKRFIFNGRPKRRLFSIELLQHRQKTSYMSSFNKGFLQVFYRQKDYFTGLLQKEGFFYRVSTDKIAFQGLLQTEYIDERRFPGLLQKTENLYIYRQ